MGKCWKWLCSLLVLLPLLLDGSATYSRSIRSVVVDHGAVIPIKTALGYSTILEFSSKPLSAVLGDQDVFKLEFVGNSLTLKPLAARAHSNLFVFTEFGRFTCEIQTVPISQVDYIVRIRTKEKSYPIEVARTSAQVPVIPMAEPMTTTEIHRARSYDGFTLRLETLSQEKDLASPRAVTLIDFELTTKKRIYSFQAASVGVKQRGKYLNLESIYLDSLHLSPGDLPVHGKIALLSHDFDPKQPIQLVFAVPDAKKPRAIHRIEVSSLKRKKVSEPVRKGREPWEEIPKAIVPGKP